MKETVRIINTIIKKFFYIPFPFETLAIIALDTLLYFVCLFHYLSQSLFYNLLYYTCLISLLQTMVPICNCKLRRQIIPHRVTVFDLYIYPCSLYILIAVSVCSLQWVSNSSSPLSSVCFPRNFISLFVLIVLISIIVLFVLIFLKTSSLLRCSVYDILSVVL